MSEEAKNNAAPEGQRAYDFAAGIFPLTRSLTGEGNRQTLRMVNEEIADAGLSFTVSEIPSGTRVFDWTVPKEWVIREAYIEGPDGSRVIDMRNNNLHVLGYATPVDRVVPLEELKQYVYTQEDNPEVIPYVTSYYKERYGFCMSKKQLDALPEGNYRMFIDSELKEGSLTTGELLVPATEGMGDGEVLFSSYICHSSMANNECSGPALMTALIRHVAAMPRRRYAYRFLLYPETIGAISYLSTHLEHLRKHMKAGFVLSCVGDAKAYSHTQSKYGNTLADRVLAQVLRTRENVRTYRFLEGGGGSDERQYNAANVNLPMVCFSRSRFAQYPEYHTSADNMSIVSPEGLQGSFDVMCEVIEALEYNRHYRMTVPCEPQLGKRGLYPTVSKKGIYDALQPMRLFIAYADGSNDLLWIAERAEVPVRDLIPVIESLKEHGLLTTQETGLPEP
ncbi:MAG: DUF4910 domain-containing protein [Lachnospiraceae bacterium]|nr:DUF4910 domain-containing protein [Lachnospiraceae bacterium]